MMKKGVSVIQAIKAVDDANNLLRQAWSKIYDVSEGVMEGELHDLRMAINNLECQCSAIEETLKTSELLEEI